MRLWTLSVMYKGRNIPVVTFPTWGECYKHYVDNFSELEFLWRCDPVKVEAGYFAPTPFPTVWDKYVQDVQWSEGWANFDYYSAGYERAKREFAEGNTLPSSEATESKLSGFAHRTGFHHGD